MSYVDAIWNRDNDTIHVVERDPKIGRVYRDYPAKYVFYYPDQKGKYKSIFDESLAKVQCKTWKEFIKEQKIHGSHKLYESDMNAVFRCLEENYLGKDEPKLNVAFYDIEVDFDPERGYASPEDAFMPITAISVHLQWLDTLVCLALPPKTLTMDAANELIKDIPNTFLFDSEAEMLGTFLNLIDDADVISGWNSEGFDIPYTVNRIIKTLGKEATKRLCLWNQYPKKREYEKFGKSAVTYDFVGRVHLDSLSLYKKYTYEERHSYRLDAIGEAEIGENKTVYEGTLDQLYNNDFRTFIEYNRQDTALLDKLDKKLKFIDLACSIAHENTVLLQTTMGAVAVTEQAIINEAHRHGLIVPSRSRKNDRDDTQAAGAYVAVPKKGLHEWIGSMDINSLYPSAIRALNMGPETIIGQLRQDYTTSEIEAKMAKGMSFAAAWEGKFGSNEYEFVMNQDTMHDIIIDWENGSTVITNGAEIYQLIFKSNKQWILSANGTIFTYEKEGIIPGLLKRWYAERKEMQAKLKDAIKAENPIEEEYWDKRQLVKKINLNSLYGAILNAGCRFFDKRIGQSTTLSGRRITRHMAAKINEFITGSYDHAGTSIIYGDTDSGYFTAWPTLKKEVENGSIVWNKDTVIQLYDQISEEVNVTFPQMMLEQFHCPKTRGEVIKAGREIVADRALFITKKRYAVRYYDKEGKRQDKDGKDGKVKAMGLDLKRADTPKYVQEFLMKILEMLLAGSDKNNIVKEIIEFKVWMYDQPSWTMGSPKSVNKLAHYESLEANSKTGRANMPGHARASLNYNYLRKLNGDNYSQKIVDGSKIVVCKLKENPLRLTSISYPVDQLRLPEWFKELPFDNNGMIETLVDQKLENLLGVLNWDLKSDINTNSSINDLFSFE